MATATFHPNPNLPAELRDQLRDPMLQYGALIAADARGSAPVDTGSFQSRIHVQTDGDSVAVVDDDPAAVFIEYGTVDTPVHATLTTAARRYGRYSGWTGR